MHVAFASELHLFSDKFYLRDALVATTKRVTEETKVGHHFEVIGAQK
jgi:hypothetical protein